MHTWSCKLEVTTPMALAGANQQRAELRPNTFKNMLRWWWRAGRGRLDREDREEEARLFGSTERACPFRLRLYPENGLARRSTLYDNEYRQNNGLDQAGLEYLSYYLDPSGDDVRAVIEPGAVFTLKIIFPAWFGEAEKRKIWASLWLLVWFGGLGARNRRGFGGMKIDDPDPTDGLKLSYLAPKIPKLLDFLRDNLRTARDWLDAPSPEDPPLPKYTAIVPGWTKIRVYRGLKQRWSAALDESGWHLMSFRKRREIDDFSSAYEEVKDFLISDRPPETVDRSSFGLPIIFRYNSVNEENNTATITGEYHNRRASPLFIKVCPLSDGWFARIYIVMKARLLEKDEQLKVRSAREVEHTPPPKSDILDDYLAEFASEDLIRVPLQ